MILSQSPVPTAVIQKRYILQKVLIEGISQSPTTTAEGSRQSVYILNSPLQRSSTTSKSTLITSPRFTDSIQLRSDVHTCPSARRSKIEAGLGEFFLSYRRLQVKNKMDQGKLGSQSILSRLTAMRKDGR